MAHHVSIGTAAPRRHSADPTRQTGLRPELAAFFALKRGQDPSCRDHQSGILAELAMQRCTD